MTTPLVAYNFDEPSGDVLNVGGSEGTDGNFAIAGTGAVRVAGRTGSGLRSTSLTPAVLPDVGRTSARTVMAWLSFTGIVTSWPIQFNVASLDSGGWGILYLVPNIVIQARNSSTFVRASVAWPTDGQPHHVAGTYDGTAVRLYLDGVLQGSPVALAGPLRTDTDPPKLWSGTGNMTSGYMDDLRIFDAALDLSEITTFMNSSPAEEEEPPPDPEPEPEPEPTPEPVTTRGSWDQLANIYATARAEREADAEAPPVGCPRDGEPLRDDTNGDPHCGFCGWVWDGRPIEYR